MKRRQSQVSDWMTSDPITVTQEATLAEAYDLMLENEIRRLLVVEGRGGDLLGIVTQSDILRALPALLEDEDREARSYLVNRRVREVMAWDPVTVDPEDTVQEAAERMLEYQVSGLPVIRGNKPVGIITESDIFRLVVEAWAEDPAGELEH
jgi:acetoin utilization protein AcuB